MKVLIADDHAIVRKGLRQIFMEQEGLAGIGEAADSEELLALLKKEAWDLLILDVSMPGKNTLTLLKELKASYPSLPVLMLSIHPEDQFAMRTLRAGASGYLNKASAPEELLKAIQKVMRGEIYLSSRLARMLVNELDPPHTQLSDREYEVLSLFASGMSLKQIADALSLSVKSVGTYRTRILVKMGLKSNVELLRYALEHQIAR